MAIYTTSWDVTSLTAKPLEKGKSEWKNAVKLLELASGECTFQRYVRYDKVRLIQKLASIGAWSEAMGLARHYLLPPPVVQRARLDRTPNDRISPWTTGRFGVAEVEEQAVLVELLECAPSEAEYIRWALFELALPIEERHLERLGVQANELLAGKSGDVFTERLLRTLRMDVAPSRRHNLCVKLSENCDSNSSLREAIKIAVESDILSWPEEWDAVKRIDRTSEAPEEFTLPGTFGSSSSYNGLKRANEEAALLLSRNQVGPARATLIKGLAGCQEGGWPIWESGGSAQAALSLLFSSGVLSECTRELQPLIANQVHSFDWKVVSTLLECVLPHADADELTAISESLQNHLNLIVGPENKHIPVLEKELEIEIPDSNEPGECLSYFLVSLLDHPDEYFRARVGDIARWLIKVGKYSLDPLQNLIKKDGSVDHGREAAGGIIRGLDRKLIDSTSELHSLEIVSEAFAPNAPAQPPSRSNAPEPYQWSLSLPEEIREDAALLANAEDHLRELCLPYSPTEAREVYRLRNSAFSVVSSSMEGTAQEREAIRRTARKLPIDAQRRFVERFIAFNPEWPIELLDHKVSNGFIRSAWDNLERRRADPFDFTNGTLLHALEFQTSEDGTKSVIREITSFFVEPGKLTLPTDERLLDRASLHFTNPPAGASLKLSTVKRYDPGSNLGGVLTPSKPSDKFVNSGPYEPEFAQRIFWQNGRVQAPNLGAPLFQGVATFYKYSQRPDYELAWLVSLNGQPFLYSFPRRNRVIRAGDRP